MFFSTTKDDQFHDDFRMCLYSNLSLCYMHVLFTEREVKMAGYILQRRTSFIIDVLQNVKVKRLSVKTFSENLIKAKYAGGKL